MTLEAKLLEQVQSTDESSSSLTCKTFIFHGEGHSLGNALRWMLMKNPDVALCGYCIPHPTESKIQLTIQTTGIPAEQALKKGLQDLHALFGHILNTFEISVAAY